MAGKAQARVRFKSCLSLSMCVFEKVIYPHFPQLKQQPKTVIIMPARVNEAEVRSRI